MAQQFLYSFPDRNSFIDSLKECLNKVESHCLENKVLGTIFFIDTKSDIHYFQCKDIIQKELIKRGLTQPYNIQAQSSNNFLSIEIWVDNAAEKVEYLELENTRYTRVTSPLGKAIWGLGITSPLEHIALFDQIEHSFKMTAQILKEEGMDFADIVRQWNYVPSIFKIIHSNEKELQHYQIFNEIRQKYYSENLFLDGYPAATGIGTRNGNFNLDFFAIKSSSDVQKIALSNPKQQDAYEYHQQYLIGDTTVGTTKKTPLFERAKTLKTKHNTTLFISGTASIIGEESIGIGDVEYQTEVTINNMFELVAKMDEPSAKHFTYLRAYIKEIHDFDTVRKVCELRFPDVPITYLQADVCRENLLVEIEGAAIVQY